MIGPWSDNPLRLLCTWARWLSLRHPTTLIVNIVIPVLFFLMFLLVSPALEGINLAGEFGLIQHANGLLQILAPSFVAALVLVAGFPGDALDKPMGADPPYINTEHGKHFPSRRELFGLLFSYLAALGIIMYMLGSIAIVIFQLKLAQDSVSFILFHASWASRVYSAVYCAALIHLFSVTFLGLHFLGNFLSASRLKRPSAQQTGAGSGPLPGNTWNKSGAPANKAD